MMMTAITTPLPSGGEQAQEHPHGSQRQEVSADYVAQAVQHSTNTSVSKSANLKKRKVQRHAGV